MAAVIPNIAVVAEISERGFALLRDVFTAAEVAEIKTRLAAAMDESDDSGPLRSRSGGLYGARNVATLWPGVIHVWRRPTLLAALSEVLGPRFGLVRVLYFDKPPEQSWSLPWHKDLTIAVQDNALPSDRFRRPTTKAGVPHVEAPLEILERMLTARIHLDEMTTENGSL